MTILNYCFRWNFFHMNKMQFAGLQFSKKQREREREEKNMWCALFRRNNVTLPRQHNNHSLILTYMSYYDYASACSRQTSSQLHYYNKCIDGFDCNACWIFVLCFDIVEFCALQRTVKIMEKKKIILEWSCMTLTQFWYDVHWTEILRKTTELTQFLLGKHKTLLLFFFQIECGFPAGWRLYHGV